MIDTFDWQGRVGDSWALESARTDRSFAGLEAIFLDRIVEIAPDATRVLDIGCGAGATTRAVAERLPRTHCVGIDLSPSLIATAMAHVDADAMPQVRFAQADATRWTDAGFRPDLLVSRHGVMFFDDPVAAFSHFADIAAPGATLAFTCFRGVEHNPWAGEIAKLLPEQPLTDPRAPGPFAFADADYVADILARAGWRHATPEPVDYRYIAGAGTDPVADALTFFQKIGPASRILHTLEGAAREDFLVSLTQLLRKHRTSGTVSFDAAAWIWTAQL